MTIPFFIEEPNTFERVKVPQEIVFYCDDRTNNVNREDLQYIDCVWMHMGYYGVPAHIMQEVRNEHFDRTSVHPIFE